MRYVYGFKSLLGPGATKHGDFCGHISGVKGNVSHEAGNAVLYK